MEVNPNKLVFIVEDNDLYSMMLDYNLSNDSIAHFLCFRTGEECIAALEREMNPMLIILDYLLPGMNGKDTLRRIKQLKPEIPVVMLSVKKDQTLIKELFKEGAHDYLIKEKSSIKKLKKIINSFVNEITKNERKGVTRIKVAVLFVFVAALIVVAFYFRAYWT
ncbi:MAG: response regulator [Bacteroidia bacterium]